VGLTVQLFERSVQTLERCIGDPAYCATPPL
jgi:hypothetical protein